MVFFRGPVGSPFPAFQAWLVIEFPASFGSPVDFSRVGGSSGWPRQTIKTLRLTHPQPNKKKMYKNAEGMFLELQRTEMTNVGEVKHLKLMRMAHMEQCLNGERSWRNIQSFSVEGEQIPWQTEARVTSSIKY